MAIRIFVALLAFATARGEDIEAAMAVDDTCTAGGPPAARYELEGGKCQNPTDLKIWKSGGRRSFDSALNHCGRSCAAGFPCTQDCMKKQGYSAGCAGCMAQLVGCSRDNCINQCISSDSSPACTGCVKKHCRPKMKGCSGFNVGGH
ncbi:unnamed protein product [Symbiodinium necroappetens]|uniref:Uncharacterized protein n=1 Tax=Symbiodinium necroappetens TaxID=1628268 RepID=A0A812JPG5_9DINO|nr:unnamed protein product [Symbiodinium necroappetens]